MFRKSVFCSRALLPPSWGCSKWFKFPISLFSPDPRSSKVWGGGGYRPKKVSTARSEIQVLPRRAEVVGAQSPTFTSGPELHPLRAHIPSGLQRAHGRQRPPPSVVRRRRCAPWVKSSAFPEMPYPAVLTHHFPSAMPTASKFRMPISLYSQREAGTPRRRVRAPKIAA